MTFKHKHDPARTMFSLLYIKDYENLLQHALCLGPLVMYIIRTGRFLHNRCSQEKTLMKNCVTKTR